MATHEQSLSASLWGASMAEPDWDAVYAENFPRVYNFLRYRVRNETIAEDLTSRTFEKAWCERQRYRRDLAAFSTWLLRIARNVAVDHLRTRHVHAPLEDALHVAAAGTPEDDAIAGSNFVRLCTLIATLSERDQDLLALKYGAGASNRTVAELSGLSESNVGTILHRTVATLRAQW